MKLIIALGIITGLIFLMSYLKNVLIPFFVACFIAYLLQPIVEFNRRWTHEKGRIISSILTVLEVVLLLGGIVYMFLPHVMDELQELGKILHEINVGKRQLPPEFAGIIGYVENNFNPSDIRHLLSELHLSTLLSKGTSLLGESIGVIMQVLAWAMTLIYVLFILI
ncbi:MAG: hypothetical protein K2J05_04125, partial [Muribaculaceae bacterium]|nr:hypothetical protein [Muribaculaceae bacterium]